MSDMVEKVEGLVEQVQNMGRKEMINRLLEFHSLKEIAKFYRVDESEILHILEK